MKLSQTHIISIANHKGGCGKTTTTVNLAAALAENGLSVCVVDADAQCNMTTGFGFDTEQHQKAGYKTVLDILLFKRKARDVCVPICDSEKQERFEGRVQIIPGHRELGSAKRRLDAELAQQLSDPHRSELDEDDLKNEQRMRLKDSLDTLRGRIDVVFIDTPPNLEFLTTSALIAANWLLVPVFPSGYDLDGLEKLKIIRKKVAERYNPALKILGVLVGHKSQTANLDDQIYQTLGDAFGERLFQTTITTSVRHRECTLYGKSIFELEPAHQGAHQFRSLASEVITRLTEYEAETQSAELLEANR